MLDNINPKLWGKSFWKTLHYVTYAYPNNPSQEDINNMKLFFNLLEYLIMCQNCKNHYISYKNENPINDFVLKNKNNLIEWMLNYHNSVNSKFGGKQLTKNDLDNDLYGNHIDMQNFATLTLLVLLVVIIIYYIKKRNK